MANPDLAKLTWFHQEGSYNTRRGRRAIVKMIAAQLGEMGIPPVAGQKSQGEACRRVD